MHKKNLVFVISLILSLSAAIAALLFNNKFEEISNYLFSSITSNFAWLYLLVMLFFVVFVFAIAFSRYGNIVLGKDNDVPDFSTFSWLAMLFCAGMGVALVFWGVSEPLSHYILPPVGIESCSPESAEFAMKASFLHWGVHAWADYAVIGLSMAYMQFRKGKNGLISCTLEPLYGEKNAKGIIGVIVDSLACFATISGVVTTLGLGVLQIAEGLETVIGIPNNIRTQIIVICILVIIFVVSAITGIDKGVKILSKANICIALFVLIGAFIVGPKVEILNNLVNGIGNYINDFFKDSLSINPYNDISWISSWDVFYWAWGIAWAPFCGAFIARISKGRTIREFIFGVVFVPVIISIIWFAIFGTLGLHLGSDGLISLEAMKEIAAKPESGIFVVLSYYPLGKVFSVISIFLLMIFFITSADSATYTLSSFSAGGKLNPPNTKKLIWGIVNALLAIGLLLSGGLHTLQTISIVAAFPFIFVMIAECISMIKSLRHEKY